MATNPEAITPGPGMDEEVEMTLTSLDAWPDAIPKSPAFGGDDAPYPWSTDPVFGAALLGALLRDKWFVCMTPTDNREEWQVELNSPKMMLYSPDGEREEHEWESEGDGESWMIALCRAFIRERG
jgi:hypothetical protein